MRAAARKRVAAHDLALWHEAIAAEPLMQLIAFDWNDVERLPDRIVWTTRGQEFRLDRCGSTLWAPPGLPLTAAFALTTHYLAKEPRHRSAAEVIALVATSLRNWCCA